MTRPTALLSVALISVIAASTAHAQTNGAPSRISPQEIDAHLRFLSSDLLEGRAPATRGGRIAEEYIATQLQAFGVKPGVGDSSYFQRVPIDVVKADPATIKVTASGKANANLRFTEDVVVWPGSATDASSAHGELVFVGYGATAPEYRWDDFKSTDVRGKVLLVLVNDPPATSAEPNLFGGKAMTYYGRWTYKYEEAERRGAAGMLIVHTTERAGYPWHVVVNSNSTEHRILPRDPSLPAPIGVRGWITDSAATALLAEAGLNMTDLRKRAESRDFRPVSTGIIIDATMSNRLQHMSANNVVGVVRGIDPKVRDEYVAYSAHWDHFGIGPVVNGDSIYNGAADNASGVASVLTITDLRLRPRRGIRSARLRVLRRAPDCACLEDRRSAQHGHSSAQWSRARSQCHWRQQKLARAGARSAGEVGGRSTFSRRSSGAGPFLSLRSLLFREGRNSVGFDWRGRGLHGTPRWLGPHAVGRLHGEPLPSAVRRVPARLRSERRSAARRDRVPLRNLSRKRAHDPDVERGRGIQSRTRRLSKGYVSQGRSGWQ